jgi:hypothetical protein
MPLNGQHAGSAAPYAGLKIIGPAGLPLCSARFGCRASAVPAVGASRPGLSGRRSAARPRVRPGPGAVFRLPALPRCSRHARTAAPA